jgi:hypothetical protein
MMHPAAMYLFDFESLAFVWIGKDVKAKIATQALAIAERALEAINCKGRARLEKMSFNVVFQGYEPDVFKHAFAQKWKRFESTLTEIAKEESDSASSADENETEEKAASNLELSGDQLKLASMVLTTEAYWIN